MSGLLAWTTTRTTTTQVPNLSPDETGDRLLEVGIFVTDAQTPWKFRGAVNYLLDPWPDLPEVVERCTEQAREFHTANGLFQLMEMGVTQDVDSMNDEIVDLLQRFGDPGEYVLAGRGVGIIERPVLEEWLPGVYSWMNPDLVLDISGISYTMGMSGLAEELEPHYEPIGPRSYHDSQREFLEFQHYTKVFQAVPLIEGSDAEEE